MIFPSLDKRLAFQGFDIVSLFTFPQVPPPSVHVANPVLPQPAPDPESHVFSPEPMFHLNGRAVTYLSLLKDMCNKV